MRGPIAVLPASGSGDVSDLGSLITACATPFLKLLASATITSFTPTTAAGQASTREPERLSSPPPAIEDVLTACMNAFAAACVLSEDVLNRAVDGLDKVCYTPDIMGEVTVERLQSLTGLPKGHAIALHKFAHEWCGKIDAKRACHK